MMDNSDKRICVVGAGFSGAVIAREFAAQGFKVLVVDERSHVAGNCHTERDSATNIMVHKYGPHIFHTQNETVWNYVNRFCEMQPYKHQVKAVVKGKVYSLPINLHTINQYFEKSMSPVEAEQFVGELADTSIKDRQSFEDQARFLMGEELYQAFFAGYTRKQWGLEPNALPSSILKRLPFRFNYDDNYFKHPYQGMPKAGYTKLVENIFDIDGIELRLNTRYSTLESEEFLHTFYSGPLDSFFDYELGRLGYRTLDFEEIRSDTEILGTAVLNYCDYEIPYTRITEHKYFSTWEEANSGSVAYRETSRYCGENDIPYYPIRLIDDKTLLSRYVDMANNEAGVTFLGRLGTYSYLDMDQTIERALETAKIIMNGIRTDTKLPAFVHSPV